MQNYLGRHIQLVLFAISLTSCINAQTQTPPPAGTPTSQVESQQSPEVIALRAQLDLMRQFDDRLLSTVYWSLGGMITIVVLIAGFSWFANNRLHEKDKAILRQELESIIREEMSKARAELAKAAREAAKSELNTLSEDIKFIKFELLETEANQWESKGVYANVLTTSRQMLDAIKDIGWPTFRVAKALEVMRTALKAGAKPSAREASEITVILDQLPTEYSVDVENLRSLIKQARA
jgi:hypothetical protein